MSLSHLNRRPRRLRRLGCCVVASAVASAACVSPALAGGGNGDGTGPPVDMAPPTVAIIPSWVQQPDPWDGFATPHGYVVTTEGSWSGADSYQIRFYRCDSSGIGCMYVPSYTGEPYYLSPGDVGHTFRSFVMASNSDGSNVAVSAPTRVVSKTDL